MPVSVCRCLRFSLILVWILLATGSLFGAVGTVSLAWDSSPDPNVVGYAIYYGEAGGSTLNRIRVGTATRAAIPGLTLGKRYLVYVTAVDEFGHESQASNAIEYVRVKGERVGHAYPTSLPEGQSFQIVDGPDLPAFTTEELGGGQLTLFWNDTASGMRLQHTPSLTRPEWSDVPGTERANGISVPVSAQAGFYRLIRR
jgi:hypothetical protein